MYAVIRTGGKQYKVRQGDFLRVEMLPGEIGQPVHFDEVLMLSDDDGTQVGTPFLGNVRVQGTIQGLWRAPKIVIMKFKKRKKYRRRQGHRQLYTEVKITGIERPELARRSVPPPVPIVQA